MSCFGEIRWTYIHQCVCDNPNKCHHDDTTSGFDLPRQTGDYFRFLWRKRTETSPANEAEALNESEADFPTTTQTERNGKDRFRGAWKLWFVRNALSFEISGSPEPSDLCLRLISCSQLDSHVGEENNNKVRVLIRHYVSNATKSVNGKFGQRNEWQKVHSGKVTIKIYIIKNFNVLDYIYSA